MFQKCFRHKKNQTQLHTNQTQIKKVKFIGTPEQLERARTAFQESVFGPTEANIFMEEDICQKKKDEGYWVDLIRERNVLAYKDSSGKAPASVDHFADYIELDQSNSATFSQYITGWSLFLID